VRAGALLAAALIGAAAAPPGAGATEPSSAIPWLSQSLREPEAPPRPVARPAIPRPGAGLEATIRTTPLGGIALDAVGLLPPEATGFDRALWGPASALRVRTLILEHPDRGVPEARALFHRLLLAEADPPAGTGMSAQVLVARADRLMALGALEEAEALLQRAGPETPEIFRRLFDIGLLLDRAEPACDALRRNASLSPTLPARIFCLARDGDWNAAEITLTLGRNVGELTDEQERALARFLDPELFEGEPNPPPPEPFTPLDFLLREAVGLPRPGIELPAAFLHHDLADYLPMRARVTAAERLVLNGAIAPDILFDAYRAGAPAASGGIWDRAAAIQALDAALAAGDPAATGAALIDADAALDARGLRLALAEHYAPALAELAPTRLDAAARATLFELLLLADRREATAAIAGAARTPEHAALIEIAGFTLPVRPAERSDDPMLAAAQAGLADLAPPDERAARLAALGEEGRQGEMLLAALALLADGPRTDPQSLRAALYALRSAGQHQSARRIALQTLLLGHDEPPR
jgi:hypothetical protein